MGNTGPGLFTSPCERKKYVVRLRGSRGARGGVTTLRRGRSRDASLGGFDIDAGRSRLSMVIFRLFLCYRWQTSRPPNGNRSL